MNRARKPTKDPYYMQRLNAWYAKKGEWSIVKIGTPYAFEEIRQVYSCGNDGWRSLVLLTYPFPESLSGELLQIKGSVSQRLTSGCLASKLPKASRDTSLVARVRN